MRGLVVARKYEPVYVKMRLTDNLEWFDGLRKARKTDAQIKIAYAWRRYKKHKKVPPPVERRPEPEPKKPQNIGKVKPYILGHAKTVGGARLSGD